MALNIESGSTYILINNRTETIMDLSLSDLRPNKGKLSNSVKKVTTYLMLFIPQY